MAEVDYVQVGDTSWAAHGVAGLIEERDRLRRELDATLADLARVKKQEQTAHGLYYVDRWVDNATLFRIDRELFPRIERPERDVLRALLYYALSKLDEQDTRDSTAALDQALWLGAPRDR